jgi:hypothetical protein
MGSWCFFVEGRRQAADKLKRGKAYWTNFAAVQAFGIIRRAAADNDDNTRKARKALAVVTNATIYKAFACAWKGEWAEGKRLRAKYRSVVGRMKDSLSRSSASTLFEFPYFPPQSDFCLE